MNTKPLPAALALVAGFVTCIISFAQHVDTVVFAKNFIIVCLVFFVIGMVAHIVIQMNFKEVAVEDEASEEEDPMPETEEDRQENIQEAEEDEE